MNYLLEVKRHRKDLAQLIHLPMKCIFFSIGVAKVVLYSVYDMEGQLHYIVRSFRNYEI